MSAALRKLVRAVVFENLAVVLALAFAGSQIFLAMWLWAVLAARPAGSLTAWAAAGVVLAAAHLAILHSRGGTKILAYSFRPSSQAYVLTMFSLAIVAGAVAVGGGAFTTVSAMLGLAGPNPELALTLLQACTGLAAVAATGSVAEGLAAARRLPRIREVHLALPELPTSLSGLRIAHVSDVHIGNGYDPARAARLVRLINGLGADIVVLTGDIFDRDPTVVEPAAAVLADLYAPLGVYAVLGNHDAYTGKDLVAAALAAHAPGIRLLRGEIAIAATSPPLAIAGIDDPGDEWRVTPEGARDLDDVARQRCGRHPCILLVHRPDVFPEAAEAGFALVLSGHYHGGQIALPGSRGAANAARLITRYYDGVHAIGNSRLHVTRGIGCAGPRLRLGCPPEISLIRLARDV